MGKYLNFYMKCDKSNLIPEEGLCLCFHEDELLKLFNPSRDYGMSTYWGYDGEDREHLEVPMDKLSHKFTDYRKNVVLFMAAMNNEL